MDSVAFLLPRVLFAVCLVGLLCLYVLYYLVFNVARPRIVCSDSRRLRALRVHCPALFERYWPTAWALQGHVVTITRLLTQTSPRIPHPRREKLCMSDGGHVCLDWFNEGGMSGSTSSDDPIVLLLTGVTGSIKETYIRHWIDDITKLGYRSVVFNYRGCGNSKVSTPKLFSLGDVSDMTEVMEHIHSSNPSSTILAVGVSMGSVQVMRYIAECKRQRRPCRLSAVLVFSVVWNFVETDKALHTNFFNKHVLSRFLAVRVTNILRENISVFEESQQRGELSFDLEAALKSRNLKELNLSCVVPMFKYEDIFQEALAPCASASDLTIPVIAINAVDDPFSPPHATPEEIAQENSNLIVVATRRGGHIGFLQGWFPFRKNYMDKVLVQFVKATLEENCFNLSPDNSVNDSDQDINVSDVHTLL